MFTVRSDFYRIDNLFIIVYTFTMRELTWLSIDEIWPPRHVNWSINFRGFSTLSGIGFLLKIYELCFLNNFHKRFIIDFRKGFPANSWKILSTPEVFLLGWHFFGFVFEVLFRLFISFNVCHGVRDCLSSTEFLIRPWIYSCCSFWYVIILSRIS